MRKLAGGPTMRFGDITQFPVDRVWVISARPDQIQLERSDEIVLDRSDQILPERSDQIVLIRPGGGGRAGVDAELREDVAQVAFDGPLAHEQLAGDGLARLPRGDLP